MRYDRHISLSEVGESGQLKLAGASVLVVGAGGLGSPVLQYLAGAGIGVLGIVDGDKVSLSNLHRQLLYTTNDIGLLKVDCAKNRLLAINPEIEVNTYPFEIKAENAENIIDLFDIVVDGTDQFHTRYLLNDACKLLDKPLVYGAIHKFEGQVSVFNYQQGPHYRCLFPEPPAPGSIPNCNEVGVLGVLPGIIGTAQANEVLKIILNIGEVLSGKLWMIDARTMQSQILSYDYIDSADDLLPKNSEELKKMNYPEFCGISEIPEISFKEALDKVSKDNAVILDIRQSYEQPKLDIEYFTLDQVDLEALLDSDEEVLVLCQRGVRSKNFVEQMMNEGYTKLYSIEGGILDYPELATL